MPPSWLVGRWPKRKLLWCKSICGGFRDRVRWLQICYGFSIIPPSHLMLPTIHTFVFFLQHTLRKAHWIGFNRLVFVNIYHILWCVIAWLQRYLSGRKNIVTFCKARDWLVCCGLNGVWASIEVQCSAGSSLISANLVLTTFPSKSENEDIAKVRKAISKDLGAHVS